jgi:hypothetical protein
VPIRVPPPPAADPRDQLIADLSTFLAILAAPLNDDRFHQNWRGEAKMFAPLRWANMTYSVAEHHARQSRGDAQQMDLSPHVVTTERSRKRTVPEGLLVIIGQPGRVMCQSRPHRFGLFNPRIQGIWWRCAGSPASASSLSRCSLFLQCEQ